MTRPRVAATVLLTLASLTLGCDDQPEDGRITKQEVKDTVSPKADAGLDSAKTADAGPGVQTMDPLEVAQHPGIYRGQTLRSPMRLVDAKEGTVTFAADEAKQKTLSLRIGNANQKLADAQSNPASIVGWLNVTYTLDEKIEDNAKVVGELKDLALATPPKDTGPTGAPR